MSEQLITVDQVMEVATDVQYDAATLADLRAMIIDFAAQHGC